MMNGDKHEYASGDGSSRCSFIGTANVPDNNKETQSFALSHSQSLCTETEVAYFDFSTLQDA